MIRFESDYTEGAHPKIIEALVRTNEEQNPGYGVDRHCERARALIKDLCGNPDFATLPKLAAVGETGGGV